MKTMAVVLLAVALVMGSLGVGLCSDPEAVYDLTGEWDVVVTMRGLGSGTETVEKDVVKISQDGNTFHGVRTTGGKYISKNEEWIKGRIANGIVEEAFLRAFDDPAALTLTWIEGKVVVAADGNVILTQRFNPSTYILVSTTLSRRCQ